MYECRILCAALCRIEEFIFFVVYRDHTRITYQVPVPDIWSKQQFAAGTPIELLYEKDDAVIIEPRPPSISQHVPPLRAQLANVVSIPNERHGTRMQGVLGESRASCRLSINSRAGSNSQAHSSSTARGARRQPTPDDGSHIHRIVRPRCRAERSWLRAGRAWACTRPLQSVHAAPELVCRGRVVVLLVSYAMRIAAMGRVTLL